MGRLPLAEARQAVAESAAVDLRPGSHQRYCSLWTRFERFALAFGIEDAADVDTALVRRFVSADVSTRRPSTSTQRLRLSAVRYLYRRLRLDGLVDIDPTAGIDLGQRRTQRIYVLTDDDIDRCRWVAATAVDSSDRFRSVLALLEAGASTGETGMVRWKHVMPGSREVALEAPWSKAPRRIELTDWGAASLQEARARSRRSTVAVFTASGYDPQRTAVTHVAREILTRAGLSYAEPRSFTAWAARRSFEATGRIEVAARLIGFQSLDRTASLMQLDWKAPS